MAALQSHGLIGTMTEDPPIILQRVVRVLEDNNVRKVMLTVTALVIGGQIGLFGNKAVLEDLDRMGGCH